MLGILATWEAEIRRIAVQGQLGQKAKSSQTIAGMHLSSQLWQEA
jgi:hypothetical protein